MPCFPMLGLFSCFKRKNHQIKNRRLSYPSVLAIFGQLAFLQRELLSRRCSSANLLHRRLSIQIVRVGVEGFAHCVYIVLVPYLRIRLWRTSDGEINVEWQDLPNPLKFFHQILETKQNFNTLAESLLLFYLDRNDARVQEIEVDGVVMDALLKLRRPLSVRRHHLKIPSRRIHDLPGLFKIIKLDYGVKHFEVELDFTPQDLRNVLMTAFSPPPYPNFKLKLVLKNPSTTSFDVERALSSFPIQQADVIYDKRSNWALRWALAEFDVIIYTWRCPGNHLYVETIPKSTQTLYIPKPIPKIRLRKNELPIF